MKFSKALKLLRIWRGDSLKKYIDGLDYKKVIDSYRVIEDGYLQRRVGRDDHFNMTTTRIVETNDSYIKSLLPVGEKTSYYALNSYEENYNYVNEEATKEEKGVALKKYDFIFHIIICFCTQRNRSPSILCSRRRGAVCCDTRSRDARRFCGRVCLRREHRGGWPACLYLVQYGWPLESSLNRCPCPGCQD